MDNYTARRATYSSGSNTSITSGAQSHDSPATRATAAPMFSGVSGMGTPNALSGQKTYQQAMKELWDDPSLVVPCVNRPAGSVVHGFIGRDATTLGEILSTPSSQAIFQQRMMAQSALDGGGASSQGSDEYGGGGSGTGKSARFKDSTLTLPPSLPSPNGERLSALGDWGSTRRESNGPPGSVPSWWIDQNGS